MTAMTLAKAAEVRETLAKFNIRANVKQCRFSVRVVVIGERADAQEAIRALNDDDFCNCVAKPLEANDIDSMGDRHQIFVYQTA